MSICSADLAKYNCYSGVKPFVSMASQATKFTALCSFCVTAVSCGIKTCMELCSTNSVCFHIAQQRSCGVFRTVVYNHSAVVDVANSQGCTPLMTASFCGHTQTVGAGSIPICRLACAFWIKSVCGCGLLPGCSVLLVS